MSIIIPYCKIILALVFLSFASTVSAMNLIVKPDGTCQLNEKIYRCTLGGNGITRDKTEGDLKTPRGRFPLRLVYYRPDKFPRGINTQLPQKPLAPNLGWCDDPLSVDYNRLVQLPFPDHYEPLWRDDALYDIIVVVGYNDRPVVKSKGSAIFIHIATPDYHPTCGCIAFARKDLLDLLQKLDKKAGILVLLK